MRDIELVKDEDGWAVLGEPGAVKALLAEHDLESREFPLGRLSQKLGAVSGSADVLSHMSQMSGRWVKLSEKSAQALKEGTLMAGSEPGLKRAVLTQNGRTRSILEIVTAPGSILGNPALLGGAAGLLAQLAVQQAMDDITDYLDAIDRKCDAILRAQKDSVLADMIGVGLVVDEVKTVRDRLGRVSEIDWSKIQAAPQVLASTQAYALNQLTHSAESLEGVTRVDEISDRMRQIQTEVRDWLVVLARTLQLHGAIAILEIERALDSSEIDVIERREALGEARRNRISQISACTDRLAEQVSAAADIANRKVLFNPIDQRRVVESAQQIVADLRQFAEQAGLDRTAETVEGRRWREAVSDTRDRLLSAGESGVGSAKAAIASSLDRAQDVRQRVAAELSRRIPKGEPSSDDRVDSD